MKRLIELVKQKPWLSVVCLIYFAAMIAVSIPKSMEQTEDSDYWVFWQAGKDFSEGAELYYRDEIRPFYYPPFSAFLFQPLHLVSLKASSLIFFLLNSLLLLPLAIFLIYRILIRLNVDARKAEVALILATVFTLKYFWNNLVMFQINFLLFIIILLGIYYLAMKKPHIAGILFTIITLIKIIPVFLAAYVFLFYFSRRLVLSMLLTLVICLSLPMAFRGGEQWVQDHVDNYEIMIKPLILEGRIVADRANHSLVAGLVKTFHPDSRDNEHVSPEMYPITVRAINILKYLLLGVLVVNGILLYRRKIYFSLVYLASILLYTHLFAGITWTAHLVTLLFCLIPFLLIDVKSLTKGARIAWYFIIGLLVFLGIEGSDTVGEKLYLAIRWYDVFTYLLLGLFLYYSWVDWKGKFPGPNPLLIEKDSS